MEENLLRMKKIAINVTIKNNLICGVKTSLVGTKMSANGKAIVINNLIRSFFERPNATVFEDTVFPPSH